jgi:hypothetical protein
LAAITMVGVERWGVAERWWQAGMEPVAMHRASSGWAYGPRTEAHQGIPQLTAHRPPPMPAKWSAERRCGSDAQPGEPTGTTANGDWYPGGPSALFVQWAAEGHERRRCFFSASRDGVPAERHTCGTTLDNSPWQRSEPGAVRSRDRVSLLLQPRRQDGGRGRWKATSMVMGFAATHGLDPQRVRILRVGPWPLSSLSPPSDLAMGQAVNIGG